jgi:cardiolipin synthase
MPAVLVTAFTACSAPRIAEADRTIGSDSLICRRMADIGVEFTSDNSVTLLFSGQEKFDDLFHAIRQARHHVHLEYFNFRNDSIASLLFDILREKRKEGVEVRALFDAFGNDSNNQPLRKHHIEALRRDSVEIYEFDPIRFPWVNHIWPRDHRKIVVIDGAMAYTGGMNVADYYITGTQQVGPWRDMHCRLEGGTVDFLQQIFLHSWKKVTGEQLSKEKYVSVPPPHTPFTGLKADTTATAAHKLVGIVNREPGVVKLNDGTTLGRKDAVRRLYIDAIDAATDSINIINPYFTLTPGVSRALKRAIKRGVKVDLMISSKSDIPLTPDCAFFQMHRMMKRGANVWLYNDGFHHSKIMMVDGKFCTVGSTNLDSRSLRFDYEENALIIDKNTTRELDDMFNRDKAHCIQLTEQTWREFRNCWQRLRGRLAWLLRPFL